MLRFFGTLQKTPIRNIKKIEPYYVQNMYKQLEYFEKQLENTNLKMILQKKEIQELAVKIEYLSQKLDWLDANEMQKYDSITDTYEKQKAIQLFHMNKR